MMTATVFRQLCCEQSVKKTEEFIENAFEPYLCSTYVENNDNIGNKDRVF